MFAAAAAHGARGLISGVTPFRRLWLAQTVSVLGDFLALFAVQVAIVFRMHGSAGDMAGVFIASLVPSVVLGPLAGVFADRWDPRRTMIASDLARGVLVLLLACAATGPQICAISFAVSCFSSFFAPAQAITLPLLVPRAGLLAANARMQQSMQVVRIASPAVASALVAAFGERDLLREPIARAFFFSAALLATLRYSRPAPDLLDARGVPRTRLRDSFSVDRFPIFFRRALDDGGNLRRRMFRRAGIAICSRHIASRAGGAGHDRHADRSRDGGGFGASS